MSLSGQNENESNSFRADLIWGSCHSQRRNKKPREHKIFQKYPTSNLKKHFPPLPKCLNPSYLILKKMRWRSCNPSELVQDTCKHDNTRRWNGCVMGILHCLHFKLQLKKRWGRANS
uniref:Uncharacterized protein n=1 Tax=Micrurus lemniscatus lemniscatus TaxID=129467 RepID=A0A2D4IP49_MICLE